MVTNYQIIVAAALGFAAAWFANEVGLFDPRFFWWYRW